MGRPRTPSNVLQLKGAFKKDPSRGRERENELEAIGDIGSPPETLQPDEAGCWEEVKGWVPDGVFGNSDRAALELVSRLLALSRRSSAEDVNPATWARLHAALGSMGLTPADRSKVKMRPRPIVNDFADL